MAGFPNFAGAAFTSLLPAAARYESLELDPTQVGPAAEQLLLLEDAEWPAVGSGLLAAWFDPGGQDFANARISFGAYLYIGDDIAIISQPITGFTSSASAYEGQRVLSLEGYGARPLIVQPGMSVELALTFVSGVSASTDPNASPATLNAFWVPYRSQAFAFNQNP